MRPDYEDIYANQSDRYDQLVSREDCRGNILPALNQIRRLKGLAAVELGAGSGRLTRLLAPHVASIQAFDASPAMIETARKRMRPSDEHCRFDVADHASVPVADKSADLVVAGWALCYTALDMTDPARLAGALGEMRRILRSNGTTIILETLGTGRETPVRPDNLEAYFAYLEADGFSHSWIRTDYRFRSIQEAQELTRFFFGDELAARVARNHWVTLPECTGIWWRHG